MSTGPRIRPVRTGEDVVVPVEGGFVRRKAPCDGLAIETADLEIFLPADKVVQALRLLGKAPPR